MNMTITNTLRNTQIITGIRPTITLENKRPTCTKTSRFRNWLRYILGPAGASLINYDSEEIEYCPNAKQYILLQLGTGRLF